MHFFIALTRKEIENIGSKTSMGSYDGAFSLFDPSAEDISWHTEVLRFH